MLTQKIYRHRLVKRQTDTNKLPPPPPTHPQAPALLWQVQPTHGIQADHILSDICMLLAPQVFCISFYIKPTLCLLANQVRGLLSCGVNKLVFYAQVISGRSVVWRKTSLKWSFSIKNRYNQSCFYFFKANNKTKIHREGTLFFISRKTKTNVTCGLFDR